MIFIAGIPTIIRPFFGDQFFWADRVEALGVGSGVRKLTVDTLTDALIAATTNHKQIARAKLIGEQIRAVRFHLEDTKTATELTFPIGRWCCYGHRIYLPRFRICSITD